MADTKTETPDPTVGRIVHYTLTDGDIARIENDRLATLGYGNRPHAGDTVAAIVTLADGRTINAKAFLDGNDNLWIAGAAEGDDAGQWHYPAKA